MAEFSLDDIESLLQEIEAANGGTPRPAGGSKASTGGAAGTDAQRTASPGARVGFSTYQSSPGFSYASEESGAARTGPPPGQKLTPLGGSGKPAGATFAAKTVLGDVSPSSRHPPSGTAATAAGQQPATLPEGGARDGTATEPNFLPVMHGRFVQGASGITPRARWGHSLTSVGGTMLMLGGTLSGDGVATNDFFELLPTASSAQWEPAFSGKGSVPSARFLHAAAAYLDKYLVIAGGCGTNYTAPLADIHLYDTVTQAWTVATASAAATPSAGGSTATAAKHEPTGRYGHSLSICGDTAYIFGGKCLKKAATDGGGESAPSGKHILSNDVYVFKLGKQQWKKRLRDESRGEDETGAAAAAPAASAQWPSRRFCHASAVHRGALVIHGGEGPQGQPLADTWSLNLATKTWRCIHTGLTADAVPRSRHALFASGEAMLAVGGCTMHVPPTKSETFLAVLPLDAAPASLQQQQQQQPAWRPVALANSSHIPASKKLFGATMHRGFVYAFGGVGGPDGASNHLVRFLAADGVQGYSAAAGEQSVPLTSQMLRFREKQRSYEDLAVTVRGHTIGLHKVVLQLRAPKLLEAILRCRNEAEQAGGVPLYQLVGNSRVRGLDVATVTAPQMEALVGYLYAATLPDAEDEAALAGLQELAAAYDIQHLTVALGRLAVSEAAMGAAACQGLAHDLAALLQHGAGANATLLFVDPHTERQVVHSAHTSILMNASELFSQLLKPVIVAASAAASSSFSAGGEQAGGAAKQQQSYVVNGITATLGRSAASKRGIIIGPVPVPSLAVRHVLKFLYTAELDVPPEAAFPTMMAAHTLKLPKLQAHCESIVAREEVNFATCCDFLSLAMTYQAPMLEELALLTAGVGYSDVAKQQAYQNLDAGQKQRVDRIGQELRGHWVAPAAPVTEQKSPSAYAARMQNS